MEWGCPGGADSHGQVLLDLERHQLRSTPRQEPGSGSTLLQGLQGGAGAAQAAGWNA